MSQDQTDKRIAADILIAALSANSGCNSAPIHQYSTKTSEDQSQNIAKAFEIIYQAVKNCDKSA